MGIFSKQDVKFQIQKEEKFTIKIMKRSYRTDKLGEIYAGNNRSQFLSLRSQYNTNILWVVQIKRNNGIIPNINGVTVRYHFHPQTARIKVSLHL